MLPEQRLDIRVADVLRNTESIKIGNCDMTTLCVRYECSKEYQVLLLFCSHVHT